MIRVAASASLCTLAAFAFVATCVTFAQERKTESDTWLGYFGTTVALGSLAAGVAPKEGRAS